MRFEHNSSIFIDAPHFYPLARLHHLAEVDFDGIILRRSYVGRVLGFRALRKVWLSNLFIE